MPKFVIERTIEKRIKSKLGRGRVVVIYGPRRIGKTTLVRQLLADWGGKARYLNCDEPDIRKNLIDKSSTELRRLAGNNKLVVLDEAQRVKNIGLTLKLMVDNFPEVQIIATGSSSFELSDAISEPLTGRKYEFNLLPLSIAELGQLYSAQEKERLAGDWMRYGLYPEVVTNVEEREELIRKIARDYLYKDALEFQGLKSPELIDKLLTALALQVGNEVSFNELANLLEVDKATVARYVSLLEKAFVIFRLRPFSRNLRSELNKKRKIYFYDLGIRNALINNFNEVDLRTDMGAIWENFLIAERTKKHANTGKSVNYYFWRTYQGAEIDWLEEEEGRICGYEIKWSNKTVKPPVDFTRNYPEASYEVINKENYLDFVG